MQSSDDSRNDGVALPRPDLRHLASFFSISSFAGLDRSGRLTKFLHQSIALVNGAGGLYLHEEDDAFSPELIVLSQQLKEYEQRLVEQLGSAGQKALAGEELQTCTLDGSSTLHGILCPLPRDRGCLCLLLVAARDELPPFLLSLQLLALLLDQYLQDTSGSTTLHQDLLTRLPTVLAMPPGRERLSVLNQILKETCQAEVTALARITGKNRIELIALSDLAAPDPRTEKARLLRQGLNESILRKTPLTWPALDGNASPIIEEICRDFGMNHALALPLSNQNRKLQGSLILLWQNGPEPATRLEELTPVLPLLGSFLVPDPGGMGTGKKHKQTKSPGDRHRSLQARVTISVAAFLVLAMFIPLPYRLHTEGLVRPKVTRFVVAHHDSILEESLVRPGDRVKRGDILARLDKQETETRLATLRAERDKAKKMFDQAMARGNTAAAQLARLDVLRYEQQLKQVREQQRHLIITSPVSGMVLSGDLQRAEGSPVSRGQTLFEVAPLDTMEVEVAIPEEDIALVPDRALVSLRFVAYPDQLWSDRFVRIEPKAIIRENRNVFIGILEFENRKHLLHPGMRARAKIHTGTRLLGWILFRKPWQTLQSLADSLLSR